MPLTTKNVLQLACDEDLWAEQIEKPKKRCEAKRCLRKERIHIEDMNLCPKHANKLIQGFITKETKG